ncbi:hypothetical protein GL50803_0012230 [Giardia duodenalis]|uniref:Uncharacterized protein n=1 Tax=Giardia intestinalis (strain ATCC 50803 / WB clone C6) TaxID=184922 RepID=D3KHR0_GIAIC|nr:hypothetical protein GL50803_0012230 [Giardia intestinalis]KAE8304332.1 hypothetical protein GL50803_0012230 [Giardia intestinalis]
MDSSNGLGRIGSSPCICGNHGCLDPIVKIPRNSTDSAAAWNAAYLSSSAPSLQHLSHRRDPRDLKWYDNTYENRRNSKAFVTPIFRRQLPYLQPPGPLPAYNEAIPHQTSYQREFTPTISMRVRSEKLVKPEILDSPLHKSFSSAQLKTVVRPFTAVPVDYSSEYVRHQKGCTTKSSLSVEPPHTQNTTVPKKKSPFDELFDRTYFKPSGVSGPRGAESGFWPASTRRRL